MASFEFLAIIFTGIGLIVSILYYTTVLQNANKTREANLFNSIYQTLLSDKLFDLTWELWRKWEYTDYDDFMQKYGPETNDDAYKRFHNYFSHLEGIGIYLKRGLIRPELIDDFMSADIVTHWEKFEHYILEHRKRMNYPQYYEHFEYMYKRVKSIRDSQHPELAH